MESIIEHIYFVISRPTKNLADGDIFPDEILTEIILECNYKSIVVLKSVCTRFYNIINKQFLLIKSSGINLPDEILTNIILNCNYKSIVSLTTVCARFYDIIDTKSLLIKKCAIKFPRREGKAKVHEIDINYQELESYDIIIKLTLNYIVNKNVNVVNGDYVIMNSYKYKPTPLPNVNFHKVIFVFYNFDLHFVDRECKFLPTVCQVITNNVPASYWINKDLQIGNSVYIDQKLVKEQCLNNMHKNGLETYFIINDNKYYIKPVNLNKYTNGKYYIDSDFDSKFKYLKTRLTNDDYIVFKYFPKTKCLAVRPMPGFGLLDY